MSWIYKLNSLVCERKHVLSHSTRQGILLHQPNGPLSQQWFNIEKVFTKALHKKHILLSSWNLRKCSFYLNTRRWLIIFQLALSLVQVSILIPSPIARVILICFPNLWGGNGVVDYVLVKECDAFIVTTFIIGPLSLGST